jgi:hypothetical protein
LIIWWTFPVCVLETDKTLKSLSQFAFNKGDFNKLYKIFWVLISVKDYLSNLLSNYL